MDTTYEAVQFNFIKHVEQYVGTEHISESRDRELIIDISQGRLVTCKQAASTYCDGDSELLKTKLESMQQEYTRILLDTDVYHNDAQRLASYVKTSWSLISKMLNLGHRQGAIAIAEDTFNLAVICHEFNIASEISSSLAYHAGQYLADQKAYERWFGNYEKYADQHYMMQDSKLRYARFILVSRHYKHNDSEVRSQIKELINQLKGFEHHAESYVYWHCYYKARIFLHEIEGQFDELVAVAKEGYSYFSNLALNHGDAKATMMASVVHGLNLNHRYKDALKYSGVSINGQNANHQLLALRLSRSFICTGNIGRALKLASIINPSSSAGKVLNLYQSYITGEYQGHRGADVSMTAAYMIADLYCDHRAGKTDRYTHDYLLKFIIDNDLLDTREGLIIEILSLLRYRHSQPETFAQVDDLIEVMRFAPCQSTESEVLRFETMLEELMPD